MNQSLGMIYRPGIRERIWRRLGFRSVLRDLPEGIETTHPGWMITETRMVLSVGDRVRLLLSGRLHITTRIATTEQVSEAVSAGSHRILYPGERW